MIPKETKCRYCGMPVMFVPGPRGLLCVEARLRPYRFNRAGEQSRITTYYTNTGTPLPVIEMSDEEEKEETPRGYAHRFHFCPAKTRTSKKNF